MASQDYHKEKIKHDRKVVAQVPMQDFGIFFNVKGVISRGPKVIGAAKKAFQKLCRGDQLQFPVAFVTNALELDKDMANDLTNWLDVEISPDQLVQAQSPLKVFKEYHNKHCLVVGQGKIKEIAQELGFINICTIEEVADAYPKLDIVDHENRRRIAQEHIDSKDLRKIDAIVMVGEPKRWETALQLILDLLKTDGKPAQLGRGDTFPANHIPVIVCNMDLRFMAEAEAPRFGHGSFLVCLEALFKKHSGCELQYTALIGKPSEITLRYAEHVLQSEAERLGCGPLTKMFVVGDVPEVDIVGANLYQRFVNGETADLPEYRKIPDVDTPQTVKEVIPILVTTGVFQAGETPEERTQEEGYVNLYSHRDFMKDSEDKSLFKAQSIEVDAAQAVKYILAHQTPKHK